MTRKKATPKELLAKMQAERYSYRMISVLLWSELMVQADASLLCRIANDQRPCSDDLAKSLAKLWGLMK